MTCGLAAILGPKLWTAPLFNRPGQEIRSESPMPSLSSLRLVRPRDRAGASFPRRPARLVFCCAPASYSRAPPLSYAVIRPVLSGPRANRNPVVHTIVWAVLRSRRLLWISTGELATSGPVEGSGSLPGDTVSESRMRPSRPWMVTSPPPRFPTISRGRVLRGPWPRSRSTLCSVKAALDQCDLDFGGSS